MTLSFSQKWSKSMPPEYASKPNHFVEKIWEALLQKGVQVNAIEFSILGRKVLPKNYKVGTHKPKLHTFRQDSKDRWKVGMKIHPVINNRTKNRLQFAPELEVKSIQKIEIKYFETGVHYHTKIFVDDKLKYDDLYLTFHDTHRGDSVDEYIKQKEFIKELVRNDGFDYVEQFFAWFDKDFTGKIIHWTDLKY